ncbi:MAG TPA: sigma 54-interacting transcriptional regulator [Polyangiaceae bacterium]|nr:sigma 54-interacting transcriptional regulator [Polyangiaceae bacterium]
MTEHATDAMQQFGAPGPTGGHGTSAGLVLLYAEAFTSLPSVWPLRTTTPNAIGSSATADLVLPVPAVSRQHAEIVRERGAWVLRDKKSTNGTFVDGYRVHEARLEHGQEVRLGDAILKFVAADAEGHAPYRIDGTLLSGTQRLGPKVRGLIGGYQIDRVARQIELVAREAPGATPLSVLLLGESGTGKEVVAQAIHDRSGRRGDFRAVNCAALPKDLVESELFGYRRGAFSGAIRDKPGLIRMAHKGTLLLDEIGDMPLDAQAKLLRVLQSKELFPLGATEPEPVDVRIIGATHRNLSQLLEEGRFRQDLYARLNEYHLSLPPLRERKEDIYMLLAEFFHRHGGQNLRVTFPFMMALLHYDWPYNVRELESCAKRCVVLSEGKPLSEEMLTDDIAREMSDYGREFAPAEGSKEESVAPSREELVQLLERHQGNVAAVGRDLGKARMQIHRWLKRYTIDIDDYRPQ